MKWDKTENGSIAFTDKSSNSHVESCPNLCGVIAFSLTFYMLNFQQRHKHISTISIIPPHWQDTGNWGKDLPRLYSLYYGNWWPGDASNYEEHDSHHALQILNKVKDMYGGNHFFVFMISLKFVLKGLIDNIPALVPIMAWHWPGNKPLSEL